MNTRKDLAEEFKQMHVAPNGTDARWYRERGYRFEKWLNKLLASEELAPRTGYRVKGEQIDGSFRLGHEYFLLEAKWHTEPLTADDVYAFQGKVAGKLSGTKGVFISVSGFTGPTADALVKGKALNVLLFDENDIQNSLCPQCSFIQVLHAKLRAAAEEGVPFFQPQFNLPTRPAGPVIGIVCEGRIDRAILHHFVTLIAGREPDNIQIHVANGKLSLPLVANSLRLIDPPPSKIIVVADADESKKKTLKYLRSKIQVEDWEAIVVEPAIERWLDYGSQYSLNKPKQESAFDRLFRVKRALKQVNINALRDAEKDFSTFARIVEDATRSLRAAAANRHKAASR